MTCGATSTANLFKARSFDASEPMSWASGAVTQFKIQVICLEMVELAVESGAAIWRCVSVRWLLIVVLKVSCVFLEKGKVVSGQQ